MPPALHALGAMGSTGRRRGFMSGLLLPGRGRLGPFWALLVLLGGILLHSEIRYGFFLLTLFNNNLFYSKDVDKFLKESALQRLLPKVNSDSHIRDGRGLRSEAVPEISIDECNPELFQRLSRRGTRPVVVRGAHAGSPIVQWDVPRLLNTFGNESGLRLEARIDPKQPNVDFGERLRMYQRGEIRQVNQVIFPWRQSDIANKLLSQLDGGLARNCAGHADLTVPPVALTLNVYRAYANRSTGVAWHAHNIESPSTIHVGGTKSWILVSPEYTPLMRPVTSMWGAVLFALGNPYSYVDWDPVAHLQPELSRIPLLRTTCHSGDVLFVPSGWWHNTENERKDSDVISLVFSHVSAGPTLMRTHPPYVALAWANLAYVAAVEAVDAVRGLVSAAR